MLLPPWFSELSKFIGGVDFPHWTHNSKPRWASPKLGTQEKTIINEMWWKKFHNIKFPAREIISRQKKKNEAQQQPSESTSEVAWIIIWSGSDDGEKNKGWIKCFVHLKHFFLSFACFLFLSQQQNANNSSSKTLGKVVCSSWWFERWKTFLSFIRFYSRCWAAQPNNSERRVSTRKV